jgi:hypothetical protein
MAQQSRNTLYNWFKKYLKPTQNQFRDWIDSFWHKDDSIPIESVEGLEEILNDLPTNIVQITGGSESDVMSQKAVTERMFQINGSQAMQGDIDMNGNRIKQVLPAVQLDEVPTLGQVLAGYDGRQPKEEVKAASVSDDVVHYGEQTIDVVDLEDGDRFLDKDNADKTKRIIWIVRVADWEAAPDSDTGLKLQGAEVAVAVSLGSNSNSSWFQYVKPVDYGTTELYWRQQNASTPDATDDTKGKMKKYSSLGSNTDGAPTQKVVTDALADKQDADAELTAIAGVVSAADKVPYFTGLGTAAVAAFTSFGRTLMALVNPGAIKFLKVNADNTISFRSAAELLTDLSAETTANKGVANGYASLGVDGKVPASQISDTHFKGKYTTLGNLQAAVPVGIDGDYAIVDTGSGSNAKEYIWDADEGWIQSSGTSVASGVTFTPAGNIAATNVQAALQELDTEKQAALGYTAENAANKDTDSTFAANSDVKYPSQKAVKTALALKADLASPVFSGNPTVPTQAVGDNSLKIANTAYVKNEFESLNAYALNKISLQLFYTY